MKYAKLINFQALSEELTGSKTKITESRTAEKYTQVLNNIDDFIEIWLKQSRKQLEKKTKPNAKRVSSGFKRKI